MVAHMDSVEILGRPAAAIESLAERVKEGLGSADPKLLERIADALEELAAIATHQLHDAAVMAEQNHKTRSITEQILSRHPCRLCAR